MTYIEMILLRNILVFTVSIALFFIAVKVFQSYFKKRKIQKDEVSNKKLLKEYVNSISSLIIISLSSLVWGYLYANGFTKNYTRIDDYGFAYFCFSIPMLIFFHETYHYFLHRFLHTKFMFRHVHKVHHQSTNPTIITSFSFHPVEAFLHPWYYVFASVLVPIHLSVLIITMIISFLVNLYGHAGYEIYSYRFLEKTGFLYWLNTPTNHNMHHKFSNCHYSYYSILWDRWLGTIHNDYENMVREKSSQVHDNIHLAPSPQGYLDEKDEVKHDGPTGSSC